MRRALASMKNALLVLLPVAGLAVGISCGKSYERGRYLSTAPGNYMEALALRCDQSRLVGGSCPCNPP